MIKRRNVLKLMAAPALMTVARPGFAQTKEKITYAYLLDPAYDAVTWAMSNGKVTSNLIDVEARGLAIPQLIQATSAKQYDVIMTAVIAIPPAAARGLELKVLSTALQQSPAGEGAGVWVKSDSPIKNPKDLKGKSLGSYALRSTGYTQVRFALIKKYGLNAALEGGDLKQVEIQAPNPVEAMRALDQMPEVEKTSLFGTAVHAVLTSARADAVNALERRMTAAGVPPAGLSLVPPSLEDVFLDVVDPAGGRSSRA